MTKKSKHGEFIKLDELQKSNIESVLSFRSYDYLFKNLTQDPRNLLESTPEVIKGLKDLGAAMVDSENSSGNSAIPVAYTYLGQFIDHDITLEAASDDIGGKDFDQLFFNPIAPNELPFKLKNTRSGTFDLDSVYENTPVIGDKFVIGKVTSVGQRPENKSDENDLPRDQNKKALIGDPRNDENLIIAQLHLAFLKFHNAIINKEGVNFNTARRLVRQHYQWIVLHDFLKKICDENVVNTVLTKKDNLFNPEGTNFFMPVEFSTAAYRFGHSMVRTNYKYNTFFPNANFRLLFEFTELSGNLGGNPTLPENWIIEWENFLPFTLNKHGNTRKIDTQLTSILQGLPGNVGVFQFLAIRNLLRGYLLSLPIGQSIAQSVFGESGTLTPDSILNNASDQERTIIKNNNFHIKTPLWYYILAEASIQTGGKKLGQLGSYIIAETIIGLIRKSEDSILSEDNWQPSLDTDFNLEKLLIYSNLGPGQIDNTI
jgi:hypothetical protein